MIQTSLEPDRRRVVVRSGGRMLGEIIYQIQTHTGWCGPVEFTQTSDSVAVRLVGTSSGSTVECRVVDRFTAAENALIVDRTWELHDVGEYRLLLDYRLLERELTGRVVPGLEYRRPSEIAFPNLSFAAQESAVYGCMAYVGVDRCQAVSLEAPDQSLVPELYCRSEMSDRFPAAQYSFPATEDGPAFLRVSRRDAPFLVRLRLVLLAGRKNSDELLRALHERAAAATPEAVLPEEVDWSELHRARLSLIQSHVAVSKRNAGVMPLLSKGDAALDYSTAVRPYWSLEAARALVGEGEEKTGLGVARFYLQGLRSDGGYCDAYDPATGRWGSITDGGWVRGLVQFPHMAEAGIRLLSLSSELHARRFEEPRLSWAATEIGEFVLRCQVESGGYENPHSESASKARSLTPAHGAAGISLLVRLQKTRGRNSLRSASLRRSVPYYRQVANDISTLLDSSGERDVTIELLRALIDSAEVDGSDETRSAAQRVAHVLLSWFFTHDVSFPRNSVAAAHSVSTNGLGVVSLTRRHLDFEGAPVALELLRMCRLCADSYFLRFARQILVSGQQLVSGVTVNGRINLRRYPPGWQPAEVGHTSSSTARRQPKGRLRGSRIGQVSTTVVALKQIEAEFPEALDQSMPYSDSNFSY